MTNKAIILFGKTGAGKSTLGNIISANTHLFKVGQSLSSETSEFTLKSCYLNGNPGFEILIVDSPGISDNRMKDGLSDSKIYQRFLNFLKKHNICIALVLFCFAGTNTVPEDFFDELSRFIQIVGKEHAPNVYVTITQLDILNDANQLKKIETFKKDLPGLLKRVQGFHTQNILMPLQNRRQDFMNTLANILRFKEAKIFKIDEFNPCKPAEFLQRINPLLHCFYEDAIKRIHALEAQKKDSTNAQELKYHQEMRLLYEIIRGQKGSDLSSLLSCITGSTSGFLNDLHGYFTSTSEYLRSFKGDIIKVLEKSSQKHAEIFFQKETFIKTILNDLEKQILSQISKSFIVILEENINIQRAKQMKTEPPSLSFNQKDINFSKFDDKMVKGVQYGSATFGIGGALSVANAARTALQVFFASSAVGAEAGTIATATVAGAFLTPFAIGGAVFAVLGLAGYLISSIVWKRETVTKTLSEEVHKAFLDPKNQDFYKALEIYIKYICILYMLNCMEISFL